MIDFLNFVNLSTNIKTRGNASCFDIGLKLPDQVWQQGHEAGLFDRVGELALVPRANAGTLARNDLSEGRKVAAKRVGVFVVDFTNVHLTEETLTVDVFFHNRWAKIRNLSFLARGDDK